MTDVDAGPVDRLLDELFDRLAGTGSSGRRALAEAEQHLREASTEGVIRGMDPLGAEEDAVARFGPADQFAAQLRVAHGLGPVLRPAIVGAWLIGAVGLVAIGLSGLVAEVLGRVVSPRFVAGDAPGVTYTPQRCGDYFEYFPTAPNCGQAAALHHWGEVVQYRVAAGVLGVFALIVWWAARRTIWRARTWRPPRPVVEVVLAGMFAAAGIVLTALSTMQIAFGQSSGAGADLSAGTVALSLAAVTGGAVLYRRPYDSRSTA